MLWLSNIFAKPRTNSEGASEAQLQQVQEAFHRVFESFQLRAEKHSSKEPNVSSQLTVTRPFDSSYIATIGGTTKSVPCHRFIVHTLFWAISARLVKSNIEFFVLPAIQLSRLIESEIPSRLKLRAVVEYWDNSKDMSWYVDGVLVNAEELDAVFSALFSDLIKKSKLESEFLPVGALLNGNESFTSTVRELIREKDFLTRNLVQQHETIRCSIARDIHDDIISDLLYLRRSMAGDTALSHERTLEILDNLTGRLRRICHDLAPWVLSEWGINVALQDLLNRFSERTGINISFNGDQQFQVFSQNVQLQIWRIIQEVLNNVEKHAEATHVSVLLSHNEFLYVARVIDDGIGFDTSKQICNDRMDESGSGTQILYERTQLISIEYPANLSIESQSGCGTTVTLSILCNLQTS